MTRLSELAYFNTHETVASYCSRLASACGYRHARSFAADLGFRFQGLAVGDTEEIAKFASIVGVPVPHLEPGIVTTNDRLNIVGGQTLTRAFMQRQRLRFCPLCLLDDERKKSGRRGFRSFGRVEWLVKAIRCCEEHNVPLLTMEKDPAPMFLHDFAANLPPFGDIRRFSQDAGYMRPDSLQIYVRGRIYGWQTQVCWLDNLPLYVAVRLCETVGASERHGTHFRTRDIDEVEWSACAGLGYDILHGGENDFRTHLKENIARFFRRTGDVGGRSIFGRLYEGIAHETDDKAYDSIRTIMRDVAMDNLPLGPGDDFFGPVTERRLHSVQSAAKEFGVHPKRLRKMLVNSSMIPAGEATKTFERILLEASLMEKFAFEAQTSLDVPEAKARLGAGRVQFESLVKSGLIEPIGGNRTGADFVPTDRRFIPSELDGLVKRLRAAVTVDEEGPDLVDIATAVTKANCKFMEIVDLLLARKLCKVRWDGTRTGIAAIRVDVDEVKAATRTEHHGCIPIAELQMRLPASYRIVVALIESGRLPSVKRRNPVKRHMQTVVEPEALASFKKEFVSLGNLATAKRTRTWSLKREIEELMIKPEFDAGGMLFYRKRDVAFI
tara:strand:+ start:26027 stop:27856 length:1830 start_codon:yes stop_codon:yes gene_type:complete